MYNVGSEFLSQSKEIKSIHADPKNENVGYLDIEGLRDFIKLRSTGDRLGNFPENPPNFKQVFTTCHKFLADTAWKIYTQIFSCDAVHSDPKALPPEVVTSLRECLGERASLSYIRYYLPSASTSTSTSPAAPSIYPSPSPSTTSTTVPSSSATPPNVRDVCDAHTDTGILTLILCAKVPGLQIWDNKRKIWLEVEKYLIKNYKSKNPRKHLVLCIMGEKISTFTASTTFTPTLHRVMVENGVERSSLLYFMDTAL